MFRETTHLSEILEDSENDLITIFKYSSKCGSSDILKDKIKRNIEDGIIAKTIYIITVQDCPILSKKIEQFFNIKHESPQIIVIDKGKEIYSASHGSIDVKFIP